MPELGVVALIQGEPTGHALWTLARLASAQCRLAVVQARRAPIVRARRRLARLVASDGIVGTASRLVGSRLIAPWVEAREREALDQLFDAEHLRDWWRRSGIAVAPCTHLNHADAREALAALQPDLGVRVSGGVLRRDIFSVPRLGTLNIHHGRAPTIRGQLSIAWGIVENRSDWIGATVHHIDDGIDTGPVLWRGGAQIAPGDTGEQLFFRSHLEAVDALVDVIGIYADGGVPPVLPRDGFGSTYRSAFPAEAWLRYLWLGRGARAPVTLRSALRC
jgi:hypothetical protein